MRYINQLATGHRYNFDQYDKNTVAKMATNEKITITLTKNTISTNFLFTSLYFTSQLIFVHGLIIMSLLINFHERCSND